MPGNSIRTDTRSVPETLRDILPPYSVILHNDDVHSMDFVVAALLKSVSTLTAERAVVIMLEAHDSGRAAVVTCPLEQAELYRDRLRGLGLGSTVERT